MPQVSADKYGILEQAVPILGIARRAHDRMDDGRPALQPGRIIDDGLIAIFFSAAFLEAFLNELVGKAKGMGALPGRDHPILVALVDLAAEVERSSIGSRYCVYHVALTGHTCAKGKKPYSEFELLFALRNNIAHQPPVTLHFDDDGPVMSTDKLEAQLAQRKLTPKFLPDVRMIPGSVFTSRAVARWAINTAIEMAQLLLDGLPAGKFADRVRPTYSKGLVPISGPSSNDGPWKKEGVTA